MDRLAVGFVADHEGLVDQDAATVEQGTDIRQPGPPQVIGDDDAGEALAGKRPVATLQVKLPRRYPGQPMQSGNCREIPVNRNDLITPRRQQARVTAAATGEIKYLTARRN